MLRVSHFKSLLQDQPDVPGCARFELRYAGDNATLNDLQKSAFGHYVYIGAGDDNATDLEGVGKPVYLLNKSKDKNGKRTGLIHNYGSPKYWQGTVLFNNSLLN